MANWKWEGVTRDGKKLKGEMEVKNEVELKRKLRMQGVLVKKYSSPSIFEMDLGELLEEKGLLAPFGAEELMIFTKQLSTMLSSGVPIIESLEIIYKQTKNVSMKKTVQRVSKAVAGGKSFSEALSVEKGFDKLYCNLIKAGETAGVLDQILEKLAIFLEKNEKIKSQVKSAMIYPAIIISVSFIVIYIMLRYVVPMFVTMLKEGNQKIPEITQFVINASSLVENYGFVGIGAIIFLVIMTKQLIKTKQGKEAFDNFTMRMPIFGSVVIKGTLAGFTRTLSTMLTSGVSLIDSLQIAIDTIDNTKVCNDVKMVRDNVAKGTTFSDPIKRIKYFPDMVVQMVKVGEQTGNLDKMLGKIADIFEKEVEDAIGAATKLIEPLILLFLGGIVGFILVAMYMPIFTAAGGA